MQCSSRYTRKSTEVLERRPPPRIRLSSEEKELFALLNEVSNKTGTTLRVAGGWVRDKLLAAQTEGPRLQGGLDAAPRVIEGLFDFATTDIDIALDDQLGTEFANRVNVWLLAHGETGSNVATIVSNPEKSKHLETATMRLLGFSVDFVNLRTESYCETSRVPSMCIGTPHEDAMRRDLTINSLFYNVQTGEVEDLTGEGLQHIARRLVATPLPPRVTLLDDPLRLLRAVRFATRLGFVLADDLLAAARNDDVRRALADKVSRERIGSEVDAMMTAKPSPLGAAGAGLDPMKGPVRAVNLLRALGVFPMVLLEPRGLFQLDGCSDGGAPLVPVASGGAAGRASLGVRSLEVAAALLDHPRHELLRHTLGMTSQAYGRLPCDGGSGSHVDGLSDGDERRLVLYGCLLLPWAPLVCGKDELKAAATGKPPPPVAAPAALDRTCPAVRYLVSEGLKRKSRDADRCVSVHDGAERFATLLATPFSKGPHGAAARRTEAGLALRAAGPLWRAALLVAIAKAAAVPESAEAFDAEALLDAANRGAPPAADALPLAVTREMQASARFAALAKWMDEEGLLGATLSKHRAVLGRAALAAWEMKPLLDGHAVREALPQLEPGPNLRRGLGAVLEWQLGQRDVYEAVAEWQQGGDEATAKALCVAFLRERFPEYA